MLFLIRADEKYNTQKNPCVVFATPKNPGVFHRPKKIPFGQNVRPKKNPSDPPVIKICEWGPWAWSMEVQQRTWPMSSPLDHDLLVNSKRTDSKLLLHT